jgi:sulfur relay (sulfurtransferase) DsrC/TusE family protein
LGGRKRMRGEEGKFSHEATKNRSLHFGEKVREILSTTTHVNLKNKFLNHIRLIRSFWFGFLFYRRGIDFGINTFVVLI